MRLPDAGVCEGDVGVVPLGKRGDVDSFGDTGVRDEDDGKFEYDEGPASGEVETTGNEVDIESLVYSGVGGSVGDGSGLSTPLPLDVKIGIGFSLANADDDLGDNRPPLEGPMFDDVTVVAALDVGDEFRLPLGVEGIESLPFLLAWPLPTSTGGLRDKEPFKTLSCEEVVCTGDRF